MAKNRNNTRKNKTFKKSFISKKAKKSKKIIKKSNKNTKKKIKRKYIIGIVTVPLTPTKKFYKVCGDSYISSRHITWLKENGFETLYIPYNTKKLEEYLDKVHGVFLVNILLYFL